jgi:hypothetical protein
MNIGFEMTGKHSAQVSVERLIEFYWLLKQVRRLKGKNDIIPIDLYDWDGVFVR